jgi:hypothetical protein
MLATHAICAGHLASFILFYCIVVTNYFLVPVTNNTSSP